MTTPTSERGDAEGREGERFQIYGRVQGVGFRWWTRMQAHRLGITGQVRNRDDGSVEVQAAGGRDAMQRFAALLEEGAPAAHVLRVDREPTDDVPDDDFHIVH